MSSTQPRSARPSDGVAWITGASSGIGAGLATQLADEGWTVIVSARSQDKLEEVAKTAEKLRGTIIPMTCDATDREATKALFERIEAEHGKVALAIFNAGTFTPDSAKKFSADLMHKTWDINCFGVVYGLENVMPAMIERRAGQIVIVSSVAGYRGLPLGIAYSSSKAAMIAMAEALKTDLDRYGVKTQLVCPGFVKTPLTDKNEFEMPMLMELDKAVDSFARQLKEDRFRITFPKEFTFLMWRLRNLPDWLYFKAVKGVVGKSTGKKD